MAWSFRKRIKVIPGVHLNFSKSGISTSVGVRGASMTFGNSGTYLNTSIPPLGIYNRQKLLKSSSNSFQEESNIIEYSDNIFSADIQEITSQNKQGIKEAIILAQQQRKELKNDLLKINTSYVSSKLKLNLSYILLYGLIKKTISQNIKEDIKAQKNAIVQTKEQIENCYVRLDIDFDIEIKEKYLKLVETFKKLINSQKIWDVTSAYFQDRVATRSSASTLVKKREVKFLLKSLPEIKSNYEALYFQNANGADLYFYPSFIVMYSSKGDFAIIGFEEISFNQSYVRFTETGTIPKDSKVIDKTWAKVNKNGSPDKRFKNNYQIPVVKYGEIKLKTKTGLNEEYEFSNYEYTEEFGRAFSEYQQLIKTIKLL
ncbi:hypothetical protein MODO_2346 [Myroides odoratimimus]|uniref:DUF4236 domain-containing protein n=1 Tax=Myroides odoratimimus TaxID=76832 RepID=UPI00072B9FC6|nr:DUF4236 domain-containing protein [Myroides odoratimimus]MCS7475082.1 DUF4236 domain-containing protein [Myroides odoratimimus]MDM1461879.1 DUF4236 domain-containing protein [Myroides odoratimimus]GAQ14660.1 hypothetical protein MODO_2346 [Myroides odoratimimus]STZ49487.1 Uncharacterised protein [Myroides odoratimimus]